MQLHYLGFQSIKGICVIARAYKLSEEFAREREGERDAESIDSKSDPAMPEVGSEVKLGSVTREGWGGRFHHNNFPGH